LASLYGVNTLGAVAGVLAAGFWAIGALGERRAAGLAVLGNLCIGAAALLLSRREPTSRDAEEEAPGASAFFILGLMAASGFCAAGYQVLWSRMFAVITGTSVYAFAALLSVTLAGIGLGSLAARPVLRRASSVLAAFGWAELALGGGALAGLLAYRLLGTGGVNPLSLYSPLAKASDASWFFAAVAAVAFVPTFLMGLIFPLAAKLCAPDRRTLGEVLGRLYAWNTAGCVAGALGAGFFLIEAAGVQRSYLTLSAVSLLIGFAALIKARAGRLWLAAGGLGSLFFFAAALGDPFEAVIRRKLEATLASPALLFHEDTVDATVTGVEQSGSRYLLINGVVVSGTGRNGKLMAELPFLMHGNAGKFLVVCFGVGNAFQTAARLAPRVDAVELVRAVVRRAPDFDPGISKFMDLPGSRVFVNDGRNHLLNSGESYDAIIVDASPPIFSAGTVNLYSKDFLALARSRLNPGGIFTLWVPFCCFESDAWRIARAFRESFPRVCVWARPDMRGGFLIFGSDRPFEWRAGEIGRRISALPKDPFLPAISEDFIRGGILAREVEVDALTRGVSPVTDDRPWTEFPLPAMLKGAPLRYDAGFIARAAAALKKKPASG
jgi:spermidine synthase